MELDLALDGEGVTLQPSDSSDLLDETAWLQQLERWLNSICGDSSLDCPTLVRAAEELSLGLHQIEGEAVVVVDDQQHLRIGSQSPRRSRIGGSRRNRATKS